MGDGRLQKDYSAMVMAAKTIRAGRRIAGVLDALAGAWSNLLAVAAQPTNGQGVFVEGATNSHSLRQPPPRLKQENPIYDECRILNPEKQSRSNHNLVRGWLVAQRPCFKMTKS
jgi:hypothetical protein